MFTVYQWLQTILPKPIPELVMIGFYSGLFFLILSLASINSPEFIYWDQ